MNARVRSHAGFRAIPGGSVYALSGSLLGPPLPVSAARYRYGVALDIDTAVPLRGVSDLLCLIEAVHRAVPNDESRAIEWKSTLDLESKAGCFSVARTILGFSNRTPDIAAAEFAGLGYMLVGVEPGSVAGIASIDNGRLYSRVVPYVGEYGPKWAAVEVPFEGKVVLVVTVEAPAPGDPIHVLCKESPPNDTHRTVPEGTVFVRRPGETTRANKQEMDQLQQRLLDRGDAAPAVEVESLTYRGQALDWYRPDGLRAEIDDWVALCAAAERRAAERTDKRLHPERYPPSPGLTSMLGVEASALRWPTSLNRFSDFAAAMGTANLMSQPDERSLDEYLDEVDAWAERLTEVALESFESRFVHACRTSVSFRVNNRSDRNLENVHVRVTFDWQGLRGLDRWDRCRDLPTPPREFGERRSFIPDIDSGLRLPALDGMHVDPLPKSTWIEEGSVVAVFEVGHVYPHDTGTSDALAFVVTERPPEGVLGGRWEVRASNVNAVARGELQIAVNEDAAKPSEVLVYEPEDE